MAKIHRRFMIDWYGTTYSGDEYGDEDMPESGDLGVEEIEDALCDANIDEFARFTVKEIKIKKRKRK